MEFSSSQSEIMGNLFVRLKVSLSRGRLLFTGFLSRLMDLGVSMLLMLTLWPLWLGHFVLAKIKGRTWLVRHEYLGRQARPIHLAEAAPLPDGFLASLLNHPLIAKSPFIWAVWRGDLSLVGPAPLTREAAARLPTRFLRRLDARPGLIHSFFIKSRTNIAFSTEAETAVADVEEAHWKTDLGKAARAVPAALMGTDPEAKADAGPTLAMFGLTMTNLTLDEALDEILATCRAGRKERLAFVNPDCINISLRNPDYRRILEASDHIYPDGIGLQIACKMLRLQMKDNLNGTDLFPALCARINGDDLGIYLLGAAPGVVDAMVENLLEKWPNLRICGYRHGFIKPEELDQVIREINDSGAHMLFVAMGVPRQETWIDTNWSRLEVNMAMGVGGLFDFMSGRIPRAPIWMRELGMEWLYRLIQEPRRLWKRYVIGNVIFLINVVRFGKKGAPRAGKS
ncbi:WecB/TagA/CpsF family glycosyltransferase [Acanthopleuribacter pedis]|uniref:WecB/TagA/CpsF family glycosyltransferase n=1 Tax=Acanthopleuribacter pedis TaxID=442870 RepID=A0A8J7QCY1_9BACT|nr:WecB/TagA/CpsF family glycosyltransferase [Acanthopleuribacter pedis]MBO1321484.1 WecB/TagA/CpsF family glycosyltransferase [Acanthopleuribacter pedis]